MQELLELHSRLNSLVWGVPMIVLLMGTGALLTLLTRGIQFRKLWFAFREVFGTASRSRLGEGNVRPFQALATALASTVGVGNIAGVSTAITLGGPGALFWMFVSGLLGMSTKFAEIAVALKYRETDSEGAIRGGAMYVLSRGLGLRWLGATFAFLAAVAAFGIGNMVQANSLADAVNTSFGVRSWVTGVAVAGVTALVILGGLKRIAQVTQFLVPIMCCVYVMGALAVVVRYIEQIPAVMQLVMGSAMSGHAAAGGFAGATVAAALRYGIARGLFSNEAGLGTAPLVHSSATTDHPVRQACYGIFEVFLDTLVICMLTGFVVLATGAWQSGLEGASLAARAFETGLPGRWGDLVVTMGLITFAFSTIIGWAYYGETSVMYLVGAKAKLPYRLLWVVFAYLGAVGSLRLIWQVADTLNGLMAVPNLIGVLSALPLLLRLIREFFGRPNA